MSKVRCPHDGSIMIEANCTVAEEDFLAYTCLRCPHVEWDKNIPEETRSLYDLGCACGPCKEKGKRHGLRYW
jgi:hypothetical protein